MLNIILAWLVYAIWGLISALLSGEKFDPYKLVKSVLWAVIVAVVALVTGLPPQLVIAEYENVIVQVLAFVMNQGAVITLIWFIDRFYNALKGLKDKIPIWLQQAPKA